VELEAASEVGIEGQRAPTTGRFCLISLGIQHVSSATVHFFVSFATLNLKEGFPTVDDARRRLLSEMQSARARGVRVIKVIHGWGSSGEGGKLGPAIR
jgi:hypothetical protein